MRDSTPSPDASQTPGRWQRIEALPLREAEEFARTARITRHAQREYMGAHIVAEATADAEIRQLVERFLQVGRLAREAGSGTVRARSPKADGDEPYSFLLDLKTRHIVGYAGAADSWFDNVHVPLEVLRKRLADERLRAQEQQQARAAHEKEQPQRRAAHEQRMREQREAATARRAAGVRRSPVLQQAWPVLPAGYYGRDGNPAPEPARRRPITDEARIRHIGRLPHFVFDSDALEQPVFRDVVPERRCEALHRVLDLLLRAPSKGTVVIGSDAITVSGKKVTMVITPDCAAVRVLNPPRPGSNEPPRYRVKNWTKARERSREPDLEPP